MRRLSHDEYFLALANLVAVRATCDRLWAGCVLVREGEILATGYNGAPPNLPECDEVGHLLVAGSDGKPHCQRACHAEANAVLQARKKVPNLKGVVAYINATPCEICLAELLKSGVKRVVCGAEYSNARGREGADLLARAWGAVLEYKPMPDITLTLVPEVSEVKRVKIERPA